MTALWVRNLGEGVITLWYGLLANIPTGFVLCDGTNGTPDLRGKFLDGAGIGLPPGQTGGGGTHGHSATTDGHQHNLTAANVIEDNEPNEDLDDRTTIATDTLSTGSGPNLPDWHALMYIMET